MRFFSRLFRRPGTAGEQARPRGDEVDLLPGDTDLEVVGESHYQDALWRMSQSRRGDPVRLDIVAVLVPEPENPYDPNAIRVEINGEQVGHLSARDAVQYRDGLQALMQSHRAHIALRGVIVGGGHGRSHLGVWLSHNPADFGVTGGEGQTRVGSRDAEPARKRSASPESLRTGFSDAWISDAGDDSYDLSWHNQLSEDDEQALSQLREFLTVDPDPLDRHFMFAELERRLYRRGLRNPATMVEFDSACQAHDAEMPAICSAFITKWDVIPLLETYKQMAIRQQKAKNWEACRWWAERGLAMYGGKAARTEWVDDLKSRRDRAVRNLEPPRKPAPSAQRVTPKAATVNPAMPDSTTETLICHGCGSSFERTRTRGRKPLLCPKCRELTH